MQNSKAPAAGQRIIFTDGVGDYRPRRSGSPRQLSYLWRAAPRAPPPLPRRACVGEVGWCWQYNAALNEAALRSGMQIKKSIVRMEAEDRTSHNFLQKEEKMAVTQPTQKKVGQQNCH
ncbi:uncharacterized protein LOC133509197 isoform X2 [Syngnathoides biaculeatus]|uniref:uncharacterized protein LOC133509197 isoform X2 n=1 Tax=Syngnathoides biaculeatus TaxID=300417 RepID=UPI002ADE828A|nr:uncharacterized protein LOC133509197 isoform X2 [Syngnathoides biaculeatus]